jgi:UDP-N-acetylglucosamine 4-epimerase
LFWIGKVPDKMNDKFKFCFPQHTKFLVTGGAGFIGSNLVEKILDLGYRVRVLDNFFTGRKENLNPFLLDPGFELIEGDLRNANDCQRSCMGIDYVLHQAALGSVFRSIEDPLTTNEINITGTLNLLIAAREQGVKRFIYASSSSVYGDQKELPQKETSPTNPLSPYAVTKLVNELYAQNFYRLYRFPTIGLRYFNVFGKRQDPQSQYAAVIPLFITKLLKKQIPTINGDGTQSRDFTYIDNVVQANLQACQAGEEAFGEVFNVASGGRVYLNDLYWMLCRLLNVSCQPIYGAERPGDIKHSNGDIQKAERILGYAPDRPVEEGLRLTIDWYKAEANN